MAINLVYRDEIDVLAQAAGIIAEKVILLSNPLTAGQFKLSTLLRIMPARMVKKSGNGAGKVTTVHLWQKYDSNG